MERARKVKKQILSNGRGFAVDVTFTTPGGTVTKTVKAHAVKNSIGIDPDSGAPIRSDTARVTVHEETLTGADFPTRGTGNELAIKDCLVSFTEHDGSTFTGIVTMILPNKMGGEIVCTVGAYRTTTSPRKIIGWKVCPFTVLLVETPDDSNTQTLRNGDVVPAEYSPNEDGSLTIPYLSSVSGITVLTPMMIGETPYQDVPYSDGTFGTRYGNFNTGDRITFNASLPLYQI